MKNNLTKKEIELISTEDLNVRYCYILDRAEKLKAEDIPVSDAMEILSIEDVLHNRLVKQLGRDPYPPDHPELKSLNTKIKFKVTITSSIGSKIAEKNVHVDSRDEADLLAKELIRDIGIKRATYKIS